LIFDLRKPLTDYVELEKAALMETLDQIIHSTQAERDADERIILIRKKMIPIAAVKIRWIICKLAIEKIIVSPYALKEGVLKEIIF
jgi:exopolyphosphatase/guanosine-5'-triphosphate,3'-diphosphate pyrophosphatase